MSKVNPDLSEERQKAAFDVDRLSEFVYGGKAAVEKRKKIQDLVANEPALRDPVPVELLSREERHCAAAAKVSALVDIGSSQFGGLDDMAQMAYFESLVMCGETQPLNLHYAMFIPTLEHQANEEQQERWLIPAYMRAIAGTYAQTEMGHGTNLRKLETTATYDPETQEFQLHSPTLTATKWWPGHLGKTSNHAIVMAQLWTGGVCHGPHAFIVQLRDLETHLPLPGITVGDIGPKFGMHSNDNGFLRFEHVRIGRDQMLMRNASVEPSGRYVPPQHSKHNYSAMIFVRQILVGQMATALGKAATIATRYAAVRRQGELSHSKGEVRLLDYQTQQYRLFPQIAGALAFFVASTHVNELYNYESKRILEGNTTGLAEIHALSSGLKAVVTWEMAKGIEQCRLACGGHGYLLSSGLPELYGLNVGSCTYEGDNIVLLLQVSRSTLKAVQSVRDGRAGELSLSTKYMAEQHAMSPTAKAKASLESEHLIRVLEAIAYRQNLACLDEVERLQASGYALDIARNKAGVQLCKAARSHVVGFICRGFWEWAERAAGDIAGPLRDLARLHIATTLIDKAPYALEFGILDKRQLDLVRGELWRLMERVRPNAVAFVDAWGFQDRELRSVLGRYDGRVYEHLMEMAKLSTFNKTQVMDAHHQYLGPMMKEARSKL